MNKARQYYLLALFLALLIHGTLLSFTLGNTYDAYVHMFMGSHYADNWFETWNYKWYTGFTMTSYPPLVHQIIALLSKIVSHKLAFLFWALVAAGLFIRGIYHFSRIWVTDLVAGYACLIATFSSSYIEALHIFGQLPSITGVALLLNACPELYKWIRYGRGSYFITGVLLLSCMTVAHHVTTIFGMVFFIAPVLGVALIDIAADKVGMEKLKISHFLIEVKNHLAQAILFAITGLCVIIIPIFPYWYWSKTDPITQVSIPHGSRASFILETDLGLVFFLIPWGIFLFFLPGIFYKLFHKRNLLLGLSFALLFLLGTGGTTPLPKMLLGETAFNILTLDRFTFWASIIAIPFMAQLIHSLIEKDLGSAIKNNLGDIAHKFIIFLYIISTLFVSGLIINFSNYKSLQPDPIEMQPIVDFLERDGHDRWRYMTLGFGDQMAWLSANSSALSVDGNYHSARRLPEMTTRAVERIENSKYLGEEGLGALRDFLATPEKYHLKYLFSNDKFYEPLLYFYGWEKLKPLENNIDLWERKDVPPLPTILPKKSIPIYQRLMWGLLPLTCVITTALIHLLIWFVRKEDRIEMLRTTTTYSSNRKWYFFYGVWAALLLLCLLWTGKKWLEHQNTQTTPEETLLNYYHDLDFKRFNKAYAYLDKEDDFSLEQYLLELSLEDGILASYAKLDTITIDSIESLSEEKKKYHLSVEWFTATHKYTTAEQHVLHKRDEKWYIEKKSMQRATPPDQLINVPSINFHKQGRRKAEIQNTDRLDVLDRPSIAIPQSHLVKKNGHYYLVGEILNTDNVPAFVTIEGVLYNNEGIEIYRTNADEHLIHNLFPKESSPFRINFDNWEGISEHQKREVSNFVIFARSMVTDEECYKFTGVRSIELDTHQLQLTMDNYGNQEVSIPQIIISYQEDQTMLWVDRFYMDTGIRPQRQKQVTLTLTNTERILLKKRGTAENILLNGSQASTRETNKFSNGHRKGQIIYNNNLRIEIFSNGLVGQ